MEQSGRSGTVTIDQHQGQTLHCDTCGALFRAPPAEVGEDCPICGPGFLHRMT